MTFSRRRISVLLLVSALMACSSGGGDAPAVQAVQIQPARAEVAPGDAVKFAALVPTTAQGPVLWAVQEPGGGVVDQDGNYVAPDAEGDFHVVASVQGIEVPAATAVVTVKRPDAGQVTVTIQPKAASLAGGTSLDFDASVTGLADGSVLWSIGEGSAGGAISAAGVYTAPATAGVYTVVATSVADGSKSASATVTVTARPPPPGADTADVRAFGAAGDGVTDDTAAFRAAAATGKVLFVPKPSAHYKITGTIQVTNSVRGDGSMPEIRMYGTDGQESHAMLYVADYAGPGLTISGVHLDGGWNQSDGNGEWAHNIMVKGSENVTIEDNILERPEGDNVLLGGEWNPKPSRNIMIRNNRMLTPRRCAVALIWSDGVTITGNVIEKPSDYVTAIDAEPSPNGFETDWNVTITNNQFNTAAGAVMLYNMPNNAPPGGIGGNFTITGNRGTALFFFTQVNGGSGWTNVNRSDNF